MKTRIFSAGHRRKKPFT